MNSLARNYNYDFLRFIGISCIILAHMEIPDVLLQARNFDVALMVIVSGISFNQFTVNKHISYLEYIVSRFLRLVVPTWLFLTFYKFVFFLKGYDVFSLDAIVMEYFLMSGSDIGLWIIRVFFLVSIVAPFLALLSKRTQNNQKFYIYILMGYLLYELILNCSVLIFNENLYRFFENIFVGVIPYILLFFYGLRACSFSRKTLQFHIVCSVGVFVGYVFFNLFVHHEWYFTQQFKYPPTIYYLSYSFFISVCLVYVSRFKEQLIPRMAIIRFVGRSTLWLYLWHWFFVIFFDYMVGSCNFLYKYLTVYVLSIIVVFFQDKFVSIFCMKFTKIGNINRILCRVFTG